ncbi:TetR/AcrR family transcriptional regulator [Alkaliphilus peptidifermentans]|uniref:Transcriptional regulator, TetR family n=1 Tax=Alkaliphilus peptidifermentans DSM 18978 TaxID=1120976 RepID=A0A1G5G416_9FIRM|nr:TetR/AcrR family transcriptional regulator [Alkaliphilus peptidifermentans]SCY46091.1 transcriptional regulator, TetR family [Alkaliphilus peptidifermentans DSM 18978]
MTKTTEKNQQKRELSKEKIRVAALNQFSKKGLFATRIHDIAMEANISQGLLYRYYPSKDDIFIDLIDDALDKINEASYYVYNLDMKAKEKISLTLTELYKTIDTSESFRQTCSLIAQAMNSTAIPPKAQEILNEKRDIPYEIFAKIMEQGQEENTIVDGNPLDLAILFWSTINGLAIFNTTRPLPCRLPDKGFIESMFFK